MRTRLVRGRRRGSGVRWALIFLMLSMAAYIRVSMPAIRQMRTGGGEKAEAGDRVTEEIVVEQLSIYLVSFGGYDVMNSAKVEAARYVPRGAAGYILKREKLYVVGAGYEKRGDAEKACVSLAAQEGLACAVLEATSPQVAMRMTAGRRKIEAFVEAERALREGAGTLGVMGFAVDRGEATAAQAQEVVRTQLNRIREAKAALDAQSSQTDIGLFSGMAGLMEEMTLQMEEMLEEQKKMGLSGRLKYLYVDMRVREIEMMNALLR